MTTATPARATAMPATTAAAPTAAKTDTPPTWSCAPLAGSLGDDAAAWDALCRQLAGGHPALGSRWVDALLAAQPDAPQRRLVWLGPRQAPLAMGLVEPAAPGIWRVVAAPEVWTGALLVPQPDLLQGLPAALPAPLHTLLWPRWDPRVLPVDLGTVLDADAIATGCDLLLGNADARPDADGAAGLACTVHRTPDALAEAWLRLQALAAATAPARGTTATSVADARLAPSAWDALVRQGLAAIAEVRADDQLVASLALTGADGRWLATQAVLPKGQATDVAPDASAPSVAALLRAVAAALAAAPDCTAPMQLLLPGLGDADSLARTPGLGQSHHRADVRLPLGPRAWWQALTDRAPIGEAPVSGVGRSMAAPTLRCDDSMAALPPAAQALLARHTDSSLQHGPDWLAAMEDVLRKDAGCVPRIHSLWAGTQPLAVVALQRRPATGVPGARALHSLSNYYSVVWAPALADGVRAQDLAPLVAQLRADAGLMDFAPVDPNAASTWAWVQALRAAGLVVLRHPGFGNWVHTGAVDAKAYLTGRTSKLRSNIKRATQRLHERGGSLEILTRPEDMPRAMDAYEAVYGKSWKQAEPHPEFFRGLAARWAPLDRMRVGVAWLDGQPIAAQWWTCHAGVAEIHKVAYDETHSEISPGTALSAAMITHALDHDHAHRLDYLIGDDAYKRLWMNRRQSRCRLLVFDPRSPAGLAGLLREAAGRARRAWRARRAAAATVSNPPDPGTV